MKKISYKTQMVQRKLGDKVFVMEAIRDLDEAIDLICESLSPDEQQDPFAEDLCPYFGIFWPAADALGTFLHEHPEFIGSKTVLELGAGLGFPSLVATHLGAQVVASDFHPDVAEYFLRNCRHSNLECTYQRLNWREKEMDLGLFDVVMGSDILYESKHPREVALGLRRFLKPQGKIILSDPGRSYLQSFLNAMKEEGFQEESFSQRIHDKDVWIFLFTECTGRNNKG